YKNTLFWPISRLMQELFSICFFKQFIHSSLRMLLHIRLYYPQSYPRAYVTGAFRWHTGSVWCIVHIAQYLFPIGFVKQILTNKEIEYLRFTFLAPLHLSASICKPCSIIISSSVLPSFTNGCISW